MKNYSSITMLVKITRSALAVAGAALLILGQSAQAATVVLNNTNDATWATGTNWVGNTAPAPGDSITFGATNTYALTDNLTNAAFNVGTILFNGGNAYTMNGATFTLVNGINNQTTNTQTFNSPGGIFTNGTALTFTMNTGAIVINGSLINNGGGSQAITATGAGSTLTLGVSGTTGLVLNNLNSAAGTITDTLNGTGNINIAGNVVDGLSKANLTYSGTGTLTLAGTNTYSGTTTLSSGTIKVTSTTTGLGTGDLALSGGTLLLQAATNGAAVSVPNNTNITGNTTIITDAATAGAGNTYTLGTLGIGANTLNITAGSHATSGTAGVTFGATNITGNATFNLGHHTGSTTVLTLGSISTPTAVTFAVTGTGDLNLGSTSGSIASGTRVNVGGNIFDASTLNLNAVGALGTGVAQVNTGTDLLAVVNINANNTLQEFTGTFGTLNLNGTNTLTIANNVAANDTFTGLIQGTGNLTISGSTTANAVSLGNVLLTNTFTGTTTLASGRLNFLANNAAGRGALIIDGGTELDNTLGGTVTAGNTSQTWNGSFTYGGTNSLNMGANDNVTLTGSATPVTITLTNASTNGSTLTEANITSTGTANLVISATGNGDTTLGALSFTGSFSNSSTAATGGTTTVNGVINNNVTSVTQNAVNTTLRLNGQNTYTGPTFVTAGILQAGVGQTVDGKGAFVSGAFGLNSAVTMSTTGTLDLNDQNEEIGSLTGTGGVVNLRSGNLTVGGDYTSPGAYAGDIIGTGGITKTGTGTLYLSSSTSTYSGGTTFKDNINATTGTDVDGNAGTIELGSSTQFSGSFGSGNITSGPLGTGALTVTDSGTLTTDGLGTGTYPSYQLGNNVAISGTSTLTVTPSGTTGLWLSGVISGSGTLNITGTSTVYLTGTDRSPGIVTPVYAGNSYGDTHVSGGTVIVGTGTIDTTTPTTPETITPFGTGTVYVDGATTLTTDGGLANFFTGFVNGYATNNNYQINNNFVLDPPLTVVVPAGTSLTMAGQITGTNPDGGLNVGDPSNPTVGGTLILTPSAGVNNYVGPTNVVANNTLAAGNSNALSANSDFTVNGTLDLAAITNVYATVGSLSGTGTVILGNASTHSTLQTGTTILSGTNVTFGGSLTGTGNFVKTGTGTQTLSGQNTFTGGTSITNSGGVLAIAGSSNGIATSNQLTIGDLGTFDISASNGGQTVQNLTSSVASSLVVLGANTLTVQTNTSNGSLVAATEFDGVISGSGGLDSEGDLAKLTLTNVQAYTGTTTIGSRNTLALVGNGDISMSGRVSLGFAATLDVSGAGTGSPVDVTVQNLSGNSAISAVVLGENTLIDQTSGAQTFRGVIQNDGSATGGLTVTGNGTLTLTNTQQYFGQTDIDSGTLAISNLGGTSNNTGIANSALLTLEGTGAFDISGGGNQTVNNLTSSGTSTQVILGANTLTVNTGATPTAFYGTISGTGGSLDSEGVSGTFILTNTETYTGSTTIGTTTGHNKLELVSVGDGTTPSIASSSSVTIGDFSTLDISGSNIAQTVTNLTGTTTATVVTGTNTLIVNVNNADNEDFQGSITGSDSVSGGLIKTGTGTQTLSGQNTYGAGTVITAGTLALTGTGSISGTGRVHVDAGAFFDVSGIFAPPAGSGMTFIGALSGAGTTNLGATELITGSNGEGSFYSGVFTGTGTLVKDGNDFMVLSGASTNYSGDILIVGGITPKPDGLTGGLIVANNNALGTGSVVNGSVLASGAYAKHFLDLPSEEVAHTITIGGAYTQNSTGTLALEAVSSNITNTKADAGLSYDTLQASTVTLSAGSTVLFDVSNVPSLAGERFQVISATGTMVQTSGGSPVAVTVTGASSLVTPITVYNDSFGGAFNPNSVVVVLTQDFTTFNQGLTPNQTNVAVGVNNALGKMLTGGVLMNPNAVQSDFFNNIVGGLSTAADGGSLGYALDQLSPQRFQILRNIAYDNNAFDVQTLDDEFARERNGPGGFDTSGFAFNDSRLGGQLSGVKSRLLAWSPQTEPGLLSDSNENILGGVTMADSKDVKNVTAPMGEYSKWNGFLDGGADLGSIDGNADFSNSSYTTGRIRIGGDYAVTQNLRVGMLFGYSHTNADLDNEGSKAKVNSYMPGIFATYADKSGFFANGIFTGGVNDYSTNRDIQIPGVTRTANGSSSGAQFSGDLDGGYEFHKGDFTFGPSAGLTYVNMGINSFTESGANSADLAINSQSSDSLRSRLGGAISYTGKVGSVNLTPHINAFWQHEFLDKSNNINSQFVGLPGGAFSVSTTKGDPNNALLGAGLDADLNKHVTLFIDYQAEAGGESFFGQSVDGGVKCAF